MKRFLIGLLASGLLCVGLAGAPSKAEAAPPFRAGQMAAVQTLRPSVGQVWRRGGWGRWRGGWGRGGWYGRRYAGWRGGWYRPRYAGYRAWGYRPYRGYRTWGYSYPYSTYYYGSPWYGYSYSTYRTPFNIGFWLGF